MSYKLRTLRSCFLYIVGPLAKLPTCFSISSFVSTFWLLLLGLQKTAPAVEIESPQRTLCTTRKRAEKLGDNVPTSVSIERHHIETQRPFKTPTQQLK